jgi:hypothetical protein
MSLFGMRRYYEVSSGLQVRYRDENQAPPKSQRNKAAMAAETIFPIEDGDGRGGAADGGGEGLRAWDGSEAFHGSYDVEASSNQVEAAVTNDSLLTEPSETFSNSSPPTMSDMGKRIVPWGNFKT